MVLLGAPGSSSFPEPSFDGAGPKDVPPEIVVVAPDCFLLLPFDEYDRAETFEELRDRPRREEFERFEPAEVGLEEG